MNDIYLGQRESNRGCFVLAIAAAMILFLAWFVFLRGAGDGAPDGDGGTGPEVAEQGGGGDPDLAASNDPTQPVHTRTDNGGATTPEGSAGTTTPDVSPGPASSAVSRLVQRARAAENANDLARARALGLQALRGARTLGDRRAAEDVLGPVQMKMALSKTDMDEKIDYKIQYGDALSKIAKKFGTTVPVLQRGNELRDHRIRFGDTLQVIKGTWSVEIDLSEHACRLLLDGRFFKRYDVGVGKPDSPTPPGEYTIDVMEKNPDWYTADGKIPFGDPRNELGTRWMGWSLDSFGIHGTSNPSSIGKDSSHGCVRMRNEDVEELYDFLPYKTKVKVVP